jgi:hypothetical protein
MQAHISSPLSPYASFQPHLIDHTTGVGTQVATSALNANGKPNLAIGNKREAFVFPQKTND